MSDKPLNGELASGMPPARHGRSRAIGRAVPVLLVLAGIAAGLTVVARGDWRPGSLVLAGAALLGALLRAFLPADAAGPLRVRSRIFDVALFLAIAALLAGMALVTVTPQR